MGLIDKEILQALHDLFGHFHATVYERRRP